MENVKRYLDNLNWNRLHFIGQLLCFIIFGIYTWSTSEYRVGFSDNACEVYLMCRNKSLFWAHSRYFIVLHQFLALFGIWLNLSYQLIVKLLSIGFIVNAYIFYLIYICISRNFRAAWLILLSLVFGVSNAFFDYSAELLDFSFLMTLILLYIYWMENKLFRKSRLLIIFIGIVSSMIHPIFIAGICFSLVYIHLIERRYREVLIDICIVCGLFFIMKYFLSFNGYEQGRMNDFKSSILAFQDVKNSTYYAFFSHYYLNDEVLYVPVILSLFWMMWTKRFRLFSVSIFMYSLIYLLLNVFFYQPSNIGYMQLYTMILMSIVLLSFYFLIQNSKFNLSLIILGLVLFIHSLDKINRRHKPYLDRYKYVSSLCDLVRQNNQSKMYISPSQYSPDINIICDWALSYESIHSSLYQDKDIVVINSNDSVKVFNTKSNEVYAFNVIENPITLKGTYYQNIKSQKYIHYNSLIRIKTH